MSCYEIVTLVLSIISILVSGFVSVAIFVVGKRIDGKRYKLDIEYRARKFIIDHGDNEILYLPYCVMASGVNRHHKHLRKIYNDFDALPDEVQKEVLRQAGYDYSLIKDSSWIDDGLKKIEDFAERYDFGDAFLYDGGKYFRRAFDDHSAAKTSKYNELELLYEDKLEWLQGPAKALYPDNKISFSSYIESYYRAFVLGENQKGFKKENVIKPLDYLKAINDFPHCNEEKLCFWMMVSVREMASYVVRTRHVGYMNGVEIKGTIYRGDAQPETFEDMYYETLMALYELKLDEKFSKRLKRIDM